MNGFLLNSFNIQRFQFNAEDLTEIHDNGLVNLLPEMCTEDLNQGDLQSRDFAVHENACEIQLHLETDVHVRTVDCG